MGVKRGAAGFRHDGPRAADRADPLGSYRPRYHHTRAAEKRGPRYSPVTMRALDALGLDDSATSDAITSRYKELVKRHHPDANGGDRSREEKLREIIHAYRTLRAARLV
jgi:DnaJ-domain-containing protein 1